jgi:hypothetical protein
MGLFRISESKLETLSKLDVEFKQLPWLGHYFPSFWYLLCWRAKTRIDIIVARGLKLYPVS